MAGDAQELGLFRQITRRDFLNGIAFSAAGACASSLADSLWAAQREFSPESDPDYYPPALTGLRGQHPGSFEEAHRVRDGAYAALARIDVEDAGVHDLVVVGGGISGLASAYFFRQALGANRNVLILDNHDDFGGHAKRNEFHHNGRLYIGYGGTQSIATPFPYSFLAKSLIRELGIEVERYPEFLDRDLYAKFGLRRGVFFDRENFGQDRLIAGAGGLPWPEFFAKAPLSDRARRDLTRVHIDDAPYFAEITAEQRAARLARMSYQDYLVHVVGVTFEAIVFFAGRGGRNNKRMDTMPALEAARNGWPGFKGMQLPPEERFNESSYTFHFPDGGATVARLLVSRLVPDALGNRPHMNGIVLARMPYAKLDRDGLPVRIRLNSTVVNVEHEGAPERSTRVRVAYLRGGKLHVTYARNCILACFNAMIPYIVPTLPEAQKQALHYPVKVPMMYSNIFIRNWHAFVKLGVNAVDAPNLYHTSLSLDFPVSMGDYQCSRTPDDPIVVHMVRNPNKPGLPRRQQHRLGMQELFSTSFEAIELETRRELTRILGAGGFDAASDILAITVNRYPHGYAYTYDTLADPDIPDADRPHMLGRRPFGLIAIANTDSGAAAFMNVAIDEGHRAVQDLLLRHGLK